MLYIFESKIPEEKSVFYALTYIFGVGENNSRLICRKLGFTTSLRIKALSNAQVNKLIRVVESLNLELSSELKKSLSLKKKKLISMKSYRGFRRNQGLPVRGQRTHTNSKTSRKVR